MDLLIKLYALPEPRPAAPDLALIRKPLGPEHHALVDWTAATFGPRWASEVGAALSNRPVTAFLAAAGGRPLGFACYDGTARGYVGPIGVVEAVRGTGLGAALLRACPGGLRLAGYGYAIVGGVAGAEGFFKRVAGAIEIAGSTPGLYVDQLRPAAGDRLA